MSQLIISAKEKIALYWVVAFYCLLFSLVSLAGAWLTATAGVDYTTLGVDAKVRLWVGVFSVWGTTMMAFLNKAISNLQKGVIIQPENGDDNHALHPPQTVHDSAIDAKIPPEIKP